MADQFQPPKSRKCEKCDRTFSSTQILQDHIVVYQTRKYPHLCDICGKGFTVKQYKDCFQQSVLIYLIPLWGGTEQYLLKGLQVLQNRAARYVTKQSWYTPTQQLLNQCSGMSAHQFIQYNSILQTHKVLKAQTLLYLSTYRTRQAV